jgi:hypothetical protein
MNDAGKAQQRAARKPERHKEISIIFVGYAYDEMDNSKRVTTGMPQQVITIHDCRTVLEC